MFVGSSVVGGGGGLVGVDVGGGVQDETKNSNMGRMK
jgi:hypothetical protein